MSWNDRKIFRLLIIPCTVFIFLLMAAAHPSQAQNKMQAQNKRLLAYYGRSLDSKPGQVAYNAGNIPYDELTHIIHVSLGLDPRGDGTLYVRPGLLEPELISRAHAAGVKVMITVGAATARFATVSANADARAALAKNLHDFVVANGYDGVDIDWEYPDGLEQRSNCTLMMLAIRKALPAPYLLSMATTGNPTLPGSSSYDSYDIEALSQILDFFNVMTYDFHGPWTSHSGHNSPLFQSPKDPGTDDGSLAASIDIYLNYFHVPAEKLNIGSGFYGYEFTTAKGLWQPCDKCQTTTFYRGYGAYIKPRINAMGWKRKFDPAAQAPYLIRSSPAEPGFITYDDAESTARKVDYVLGKRNLGGFFIWAIGGADSDYDGHSEDLLTAMSEAFKKYGTLPAKQENPPVAPEPAALQK
jgi:chitinase